MGLKSVVALSLACLSAIPVRAESDVLQYVNQLIGSSNGGWFSKTPKTRNAH